MKTFRVTLSDNVLQELEEEAAAQGQTVEETIGHILYKSSRRAQAEGATIIAVGADNQTG